MMFSRHFSLILSCIINQERPQPSHAAPARPLSISPLSFKENINSHLWLCLGEERRERAAQWKQAVAQQLEPSIERQPGHSSEADLLLFVLMKFLLNEVIIAAVRNEKVGPIDFTPSAGSRPCWSRAVNGNCQLTKTILASRQFEEKLPPASAQISCHSNHRPWAKALANLLRTTRKMRFLFWHGCIGNCGAESLSAQGKCGRTATWEHIEVHTLPGDKNQFTLE